VIVQRKSIAFACLLAISYISKASDTGHAYSLVAGRDKRCGPLTSIVNGGNRRGYTRLDSLGSLLPLKHELVGSVRASRVRDFDFDNDGIFDQVYFREEFTTYQKATIWYVFRGPLVATGDQPRDLATLTVYPCQFDSTVPLSQACAPFSQNADEARLDVSIKGFAQRVSFRVRYTYAFPILERGKTLLLLTSEARDTEEYAAAIEPAGDRAYRSLCIFKRTVKGPDLDDLAN
jgi:hypothetical protein